MASDGKVVIEIEGDNKKLKDALEDTTTAIDKESKQWGETGSSAAGTIGSSFEGMFSKIAASAAAAKIGQLIRDWAMASIDMASSLQEVQNVVDVTFGEEGSKKIEKWAKLSSSTYGLTELQAKKYASTLGSMAKSTGMTDDEIFTMSTDLAGLAADIASFNNLSFDEAFYKIRAGLSGESEPLKAIGYDVMETSLDTYAQSLGMGKFSEMDMGMKYLLRYQYLMKQATEKGTLGDFARTLPDSLANKERLSETKTAELQAKTGEVLMPLAQEWQDFQLNFLNMLLGDDGVIVQGTQSQLQTWLDQARAQTGTATEQMNSAIRERAARLGIEEGEFEPGIFKTFEEFAYQTMLTRTTFGGREGAKYQAAVDELAPLISAYDEAQAKVSDFEAQLNKLAEIDAESGNAGAELANNITTGVNNAIPGLQTAVANYNAALSQLGNVSTGGIRIGVPYNPAFRLNGTHSGGLDYVPFNNYLASLHEGESILTAQEAKVWRAFKNGGASIRNTVDYDALGMTMRDNIHAGGNVYLDGQTVGRVISARQADSYRAMERSGFQQ